MIHIWWNQRKKQMNNTSDALKIIGRSPLAQAELSIDKDPELLAMLKDSSVNAQVSMIIYDVRKQAGLTQRQLADLVGTTQSVIARLEDAMGILCRCWRGLRRLWVRSWKLRCCRKRWLRASFTGGFYVGY
jgi:DNA-binding transcriptional regulator YiaG